VRSGLTALVAALLLAACGDTSVSEGTEPVALTVNLAGATGTVAVSECILSQATATLYFDGNLGLSSGDFSARAVWTSSDPGVVAVSNGELPAAGGSGYYAAGVLLPRRTGVAQVSAKYLDFTSTMTVEVQPVLMTLEPALSEIAERSSQSFELKLASSSGLVVSAAEGIGWSIDQAVTNANVDSSGKLTANAAGDARFTLRAQPVGCDRSASMSLKVSAIDHLSYSREQPEAPLPVGYSDLLKVYAYFADAGSPPQNLTAQLSYEAEDDEILGLTLGSDYLLVTALDTGSSGASASFEPENGKALSLTLPSYVTEELEPSDLRLTPDSQRLVYPATGLVSALALFEDGIERPVSRHVVWSSSDSNLLTVNGSGDSAGEISTANVDYSGQVYAALGSYTASSDVLVYSNDGS
jgi:hypothetical protein